MISKFFLVGEGKEENKNKTQKNPNQTLLTSNVTTKNGDRYVTINSLYNHRNYLLSVL